MKQKNVKQFVKLLKDDVNVLVIDERCKCRLYHGKVAEIPQCISEMLVLAKSVAKDDETSITLLIDCRRKST